MSSWIEPQYDPRLNTTIFYPTDHPEGVMRGTEHPPSLRTGYSSYSPRHSPNASRPPYNLGLYGPRPQPSHSDQIQSLSTPAMAPPAMTEFEEDNEYMEVEPMIDAGQPIFESEYDDEAPSHGRRRFVGGFIRGLRKIPRVVKRGFFPDKREVLTPPGLAYHQSPPYTLDTQPQEPEEAPPYDALDERVDGDFRYMDSINMPAEFRSSASPSRTPSHSLRAPRSESQLTYQSLTNPPARHVSQHGSLHHFQRSSPPRTVRNPDPPSPTDESGTMNGNSPRHSQTLYETVPETLAVNTRLSPLGPTRRPIVTVQSPTGSPIYIEPQRSDDYVGMDMDESSEEHAPTSEPPVPSQFARIAKFFRDLNNLPWVSPNVTVDFDPAEAERARQAHTRVPGRSWYTGHLHDIDLLGTSSSTRRLTAPSGHSLARAPGSSATLAPQHGTGSASSSEGASTHLPSAPANASYPSVPTLALPPQPFYFYPYPAMPQPPPPPRAQDGKEQASPQSSGTSDVPRQPYLFMVAMPPGYVPGPVDPSRSMLPMPAFGVPYPPPV
ncbi:hypothetical protein F5148DRAFT_1159963 [Russula earlei]|uniref:Uncharacterized protein n=1 Tax=Russula earlei TaxID=71964 RepID=A0ACC0UMS9_9AGAM|nr:hypothetical protein F5148DRAFT_1159963 [Russula earlei]